MYAVRGCPCHRFCMTSDAELQASDWRPSAKDKKKSNNYSKLITGKAKSATAHVDLTADCASSSSAAQQV